MCEEEQYMKIINLQLEKQRYPGPIIKWSES